MVSSPFQWVGFVHSAEIRDSARPSLPPHSTRQAGSLPLSETPLDFLSNQVQRHQWFLRPMLRDDVVTRNFVTDSDPVLFRHSFQMLALDMHARPESPRRILAHASDFSCDSLTQFFCQLDAAYAKDDVEQSVKFWISVKHACDGALPSKFVHDRHVVP
jgi:hypothetical protein